LKPSSRVSITIITTKHVSKMTKIKDAVKRDPIHG
jgi:hypothetical protein